MCDIHLQRDIKCDDLSHLPRATFLHKLGVNCLLLDVFDLYNRANSPGCNKSIFATHLYNIGKCS